MDHQDLRRAHSSGQEGHAVHVCHKCGWPFPNPHPSAKHRRAHKKVCGRVEGYKVADHAQMSVSDDEQHQSDDEDPKTPSPKVLERSIYEKGSGGFGEGSLRSDDFKDAVAEFSDSGSGAWTGERLGDISEVAADVERAAKSDLDPIPFRNDGGTTEDNLNPIKYETATDASEDIKKTDVTDSMIESCLTSTDQEAEVTGITATNLDRNIISKTSFISDGRTEESNVLLGDSNGLHPIEHEMVTDASESIKKTVAAESMIENCLTSVDQDSEVRGIAATNLDRNMTLHSKVAGEAVEGASKLEGSNDEVVPSEKDHSVGFDIHIPQIDVPPQVESVALNASLSTAEKVDDTDRIQYLSAGNGKEEETANVHVLSVPDVIHVVEDPVLMLEDFRDHKGKQSDQLTFLDSLEQFDDKETDVKQPNINENLSIFQSSHSSGGNVVSPDTNDLEVSLEPDVGSSKPMSEANMSQSDINMFKNQSSDEIGTPADALMPQIAKTSMVGFPGGQESDDKSYLQVNFAASDAGINQTTHSVCPDNNEKDGICNGSEESGDHSKKGPTEENLVASPIATLQSAEGEESYDKSNESLQVNSSAGDAGIDAGIDQTTHSVGPDDDKKDGNCDGSGESGDDSRKGPAEENLVANLMASVQSDGYENQVCPSAELLKDDASDYEKGVIGKCNRIEDAGYNEKAETSDLCADADDKTKGAKEIFFRDPAINLQSVSGLSELQFNPVTNTASDCEKDKTGKCDVIGYHGDHEKAEKYASSGEDLSQRSADKTSVEDPTSNLESVVSLSDSQTHPAKNLPHVEAEKFVISENESMEGSLEENTLVKSELTPESSVNLTGSKTIVEEATVGSRMELVETSGRHLASSSSCSKVAGEILSDTQKDVSENEIAYNDKIQKEVDASAAAGSDQDQNVESFEKILEDHGEKEPGFSALVTESSVQSFIASEDSGAREVHAVASGITSQSLLEEGDNNLVRQQPSSTAIDVDSNSQTDSMEANCGSFSVPSMQSDAEAVPRTHSQASLEEGSDLKKSKVESQSQHSHKSDMFEAPSFMTLVEPRGGEGKKATGSEIPTAVQNPEEPKPASLQTGWFPSMTHVVNESQGRKKNEEIIAKVTNWNTGKQHTPLKSLLGEASSESKGKPLNQKESLAPASAPQKDDKAPVTTTVNSILNPESPTGEAAKKENAKEWNSPARYPSVIKSEKKKVKGKSWVQFVCCASVN